MPIRRDLFIFDSKALELAPFIIQLWPLPMSLKQIDTWEAYTLNGTHTRTDHKFTPKMLHLHPLGIDFKASNWIPLLLLSPATIIAKRRIPKSLWGSVQKDHLDNMNSEHVTARCRRHHLRFVYKINGIIFQFLAYVTHGMCVCVSRFHVVFSRNNDAYNRHIIVTFVILLFLFLSYAYFRWKRYKTRSSVNFIRQLNSRQTRLFSC